MVGDEGKGTEGMLGGGVSGACRVVCGGILGREGESGKLEGRRRQTRS